jgi:hypothetical protein
MQTADVNSHRLSQSYNRAHPIEAVKMMNDGFREKAERAAGETLCIWCLIWILKWLSKEGSVRNL